jgi:transposase
MPRKKPAIPVRRHYSADLKRRVIHQAYTLHKCSKDIATDLDMPLRVVQRVKKTWQEIGEVCHDRKYMGRTPLLSMVETRVRVWTMFSVTYFYAYAPVHAGIARTHPRYVSG